MSYFYWTYRPHPHTDKDYLFDGIIYSQDAHLADRQSRDIIRDIEHPDVENDLGIHVITPINDIITDLFDVETADKLDPEKLATKEDNILQQARSALTEEDILEVAERQEKFDRHEMGEDVDGIIDVETDSKYVDISEFYRDTN